MDKLALPDEVQKLCTTLSETTSGHAHVEAPAWPAAKIKALASAEVFRWFLPKHFGGTEWNDEQILSGYLALSQACLTTTFVLTQWNAAAKRILGSENEPLKARLLPAMASGEQFATVGISHLTTSRQHVAKPVLKAEAQADGFLLNGLSPWVTAAAYADWLVVGATLEDATQVLLAVDAKTSGVQPHLGVPLAALSGSCTDRVEFKNTFVPQDQVIAGPIPNVLSAGTGGGAGGLQTSTLAIGLSLGAVEFLEKQATLRSDLASVATKLRDDVDQLVEALFQLAAGEEAGCTSSDLRQRANSFVLRATQAALTAAKGAGFMATHPTGRWATEALFFLVWSCPQPVANANLCELAHIEPS